jgi:hypothetical protein
MAQTGYTPILIYASGTTGNTPSASNLTSSASGAELALNYYDGKLFYKDASGNVQVLATKGGVGNSSNTQILYNSSGLVTGSANLTYNGSAVTISQNLFVGSAGANGIAVNSTLDWTTTAYNAIQGKNGGGVAFENTYGGLFSTGNLYNASGSGWLYKTNNYGLVNVLEPNLGEYQWYTAPQNAGGAGATATVTKRMAFSTAGNLMVANSQSPSPASVSTIEVGNYGSSVYSLASGTTALGSNFYYNGGNKFAANGRAALYQQDAGIHSWYSSNISNVSGGGFTAAMNLIGTLSYASGGFLSIGAATTQTNAETIRISKGSGAVYMIADETTNNTRALFGVDGTAQESFVGSYSNNPVQMRVNNSTVARFFSNGMNVGNTSPLVANYTQNLEVYAPSTGSAGLRLYNGSGATTGVDFVVGSDGVAYVLNRNNQNINFGINGSTGDAYLSTGKNWLVGIAPGVASGGDDRLVIRNTSTGYSALRIIDGSDTAKTAMFGYAYASSNYNSQAQAGDACMRGTNGAVIAGGNGSYGIRVNSAGLMSAPYQPSFWAYKSSAQNTASDVTFQGNNTYYNRGSNYNTSNYRFTVPTGGAGMYIFGGNLRIDGNCDYIYFDPAVNGTRVYNASVGLAGLSTRGFASFAAGQTTFALYLNDGDYVTMNIAWSGGGTTLDVNAQTFWYGTKVS